MTMAFGYAPQGSSGMSYCKQTPFPLREGSGHETRLGYVAKQHPTSYVQAVLAASAKFICVKQTLIKLTVTQASN